MTDPAYDVIVAGLGTMGTSACYQLAAAGLHVLGLEQHGIGHALGAYTGESRMFRLSYFEHADFVPLLREAATLWRQAEAEWDRGEVFAQTGGLYLGAPDSALVAGSRTSAEHNGIAHEILARGEIARRFPQFRLPDHFIGLHEPAAGYLRSQLAVEMFAELAMRHGATLRGGEPVTAWASDGGGIRVTTNTATYRAAKLVLATGAWTGKVVRDLGVPLVVTRQCLGWVQPLTFVPFERERFCCWAIEGPRDASGVVEFHYGFPLGAGGPGLKIAEHVVREPVDDADTADRVPNAVDEARFRLGITRYLPGADGPTLAMRVCLYTNTPDSFFILDRHPAHANVVLCCGFSGHGFKFASVVGRVARDFVMKDGTPAGVGFLGLGRFGDKESARCLRL